MGLSPSYKLRFLSRLSSFQHGGILLIAPVGDTRWGGACCVPMLSAFEVAVLRDYLARSFTKPARQPPFGALLVHERLAAAWCLSLKFVFLLVLQVRDLDRH